MSEIIGGRCDGLKGTWVEHPLERQITVSCTRGQWSWSAVLFRRWADGLLSLLLCRAGLSDTREQAWAARDIGSKMGVLVLDEAHNAGGGAA